MLKPYNKLLQNALMHGSRATGRYVAVNVGEPAAIGIHHRAARKYRVRGKVTIYKPVDTVESTPIGEVSRRTAIILNI